MSTTRPSRAMPGPVMFLGTVMASFMRPASRMKRPHKLDHLAEGRGGVRDEGRAEPRRHSGNDLGGASPSNGPGPEQSGRVRSVAARFGAKTTRIP